MKKTIVICILSLLSYSGFSQALAQQSSIKTKGFFGEVKEVTTMTYATKTEYDNIAKTFKVSKKVELFDRNGNIIEIKNFKNDSLSDFLKYEYDSINRLIKFTRYDRYSKIIGMGLTKFISDDYTEYLTLSADGTTRSITTEDFNITTNSSEAKSYFGRELQLIERKIFDAEKNVLSTKKYKDSILLEEKFNSYNKGVLVQSTTNYYYPPSPTNLFKISYDKAGNRINEKLFSGDNLEYNIEYKYLQFDSKGNWIQQAKIPLITLSSFKPKTLIFQRSIVYY